MMIHKVISRRLLLPLSFNSIRIHLCSTFCTIKRVFPHIWPSSEESSAESSTNFLHKLQQLEQVISYDNPSKENIQEVLIILHKYKLIKQLEIETNIIKKRRKFFPRKHRSQQFEEYFHYIINAVKQRETILEDYLRKEQAILYQKSGLKLIKEDFKEYEASIDYKKTAEELLKEFVPVKEAKERLNHKLTYLKQNFDRFKLLCKKVQQYIPNIPIKDRVYFFEAFNVVFEDELFENSLFVTPENFDSYILYQEELAEDLAKLEIIVKETEEKLKVGLEQPYIKKENIKIQSIKTETVSKQYEDPKKEDEKTKKKDIKLKDSSKDKSEEKIERTYEGKVRKMGLKDEKKKTDDVPFFSKKLKSSKEKEVKKKEFEENDFINDIDYDYMSDLDHEDTFTALNSAKSNRKPS